MRPANIKGTSHYLNLKENNGIIRLEPEDQSALLKFANGKIQKQELNHGSSFLSQSAPFLSVGDFVSSVQITNDQALSEIFCDHEKQENHIGSNP